MVKIIPISKKPNYIVVTQYKEGITYHYHLNELGYINKACDVGCWNVKYRNNG